MSERETQLMIAIRDGSTEAFEDLYTLLRRPVANYLYRLCGRASRVDDLVQEVFLRVWRAAPRWQPTAKVSTWIFQIAHNAWANEASRKREEAMPPEAQEIEVTPSRNMDRAETSEAVLSALLKLPEGEREVLVLAEYNGLRYEEISDVLGIPVGTVKSRMFNAMKRLREILRPS